MAAKPELNTPAETDTFATLKTLNTYVATIHINYNLKNKNGYECSTNLKPVKDETSTLPEKNLEKLVNLILKWRILLMMLKF